MFAPIYEVLGLHSGPWRGMPSSTKQHQSTCRWPAIRPFLWGPVWKSRKLPLRGQHSGVSLVYIVEVNEKPSTTTWNEVIFKSFISVSKSRPFWAPIKASGRQLWIWRRACWNQWHECLPTFLLSFLPFLSLWWLSYLYLQATQGDRQLTRTQMTTQNKMNKYCSFI